MIFKIKKRIEIELRNYAAGLDQKYSLNKLSPILSNNIKEFICRHGKRIRPILFCIGYLGFSKKAPAGLYQSALSFELLHDFLLIHDDLVDKSAMRRGKPSMHTLFTNYLHQKNETKFSGEDLAIIAGDIIYALAMDSFLRVQENKHRKEEALKKFISSAISTGSGEFIELLLGIKPIDKVTKKDIYKIYDYKTANYTFSSPLTIGATLAGARTDQLKKLHLYGMLLGKAFQIKDDIIGVFGKQRETGKSNITDIKEAKRTLLIWFAYNHANRKDQLLIKKNMQGKIAGRNQLLRIRKIMMQTGSISYAQAQIKDLYLKAKKQLNCLDMNLKFKQALDSFSKEMLGI